MRFLIVALVCLFSANPVLALTPDATREQIIAELGKPSSVARLGAREILNFPKGVRIELEAGRIVATKGIMLVDAPAALPAQPAPPPQTAAPTTVKASPPPAPPQAATKVEPKQPRDPSAGDADQPTDEHYEKLMQTLDAASDGQSEESNSESKPGFNLLTFIIELALSTVITVLALKLACKYWGATVFWSAIFIVAAVDTGVRAIIAGLLIGVAGFPDTFYADQCAATLVMFFLLKKLSINHSIQQAVQLTMTTKTFTVVVGLMLISFILHLI